MEPKFALLAERVEDEDREKKSVHTFSKAGFRGDRVSWRARKKERRVPRVGKKRGGHLQKRSRDVEKPSS